MKTKLIVIGLVLLLGTFLFPIFHVVKSHQPVFNVFDTSTNEMIREAFLDGENLSKSSERGWKGISEEYRHFFILTPPKIVSLSELKKGYRELPFRGGLLAGQNYKATSYWLPQNWYAGYCRYYPHGRSAFYFSSKKETMRNLRNLLIAMLLLVGSRIISFDIWCAFLQLVWWKRA